MPTDKYTHTHWPSVYISPNTIVHSFTRHIICMYYTVLIVVVSQYTSLGNNDSAEHGKQDTTQLYMHVIVVYSSHCTFCPTKKKGHGVCKQCSCTMWLNKADCSTPELQCRLQWNLQTTTVLHISRYVWAYNYAGIVWAYYYAGIVWAYYYAGIVWAYYYAGMLCSLSSHKRQTMQMHTC